MIDGLKPYSEYKDSGVSWLGEIPKSWDIRRGKYLFRSKKELNLNALHTNVLSLTLRGVVNNNPDNPIGMVPKDYATYQLFRKNDLVFKLIDLENFKTSRVGLVHEDGIMSSAYIRLSLINGGDIRYFYHQFFDLYLRGVFNKLGAGVRATLGQNDLLDLGIALPGLDEQKQIVRFLDAQDRRINRLIHSKRRLIELLNEQKQAIIHKAVTRGLDPNVKLKSSGVEWLGDVPEHWDVVRAKQVSSIFIPQRHKPELNDQGGFPWITPVNMGHTYTRKISLFVSKTAAEMAGSRTIPAGSVIATCIGRFGISSICEDSVVINQQLQAFIPNNSISSDFLRHCIQVARPYFEMNGNSTTLAYVDQQGFAEMPLPFPKKDEQEAIEDYLQKSLAIIERTESSTEHEIDLLNEYRTRLISDVVTGKLDVRGVELPAMDEAEIMGEIDIGEDTEMEAIIESEEVANAY